jgi:hypothetical protein
VVLKAFREAIAHRCGLTSAEVTQFLQQRFDIVHIGTYVCPRTGDLVFSDIDTRTGACLGPDVDYLTPDALAMLLKGSQTRLVIVTSCDSLALVPTLLTVTNVVATRDLVSAKMMAKWVSVLRLAADAFLEGIVRVCGCAESSADEAVFAGELRRSAFPVPRFGGQGGGVSEQAFAHVARPFASTTTLTSLSTSAPQLRSRRFSSQ